MINSYEDRTDWGVVIVTNLYAGNFERELTAFCTGEIGECEVGDAEAASFQEDFNTEGCDENNPFWDAINHLPDDKGCYRPCSIFRDSAGEYKSVIIFFHEQPTIEQVEIIKKRIDLYLAVGHKRTKGLVVFDVVVIKRQIKVTAELPLYYQD